MLQESERLRIPVVFPKVLGPMHHPTKEDPDSGVLEAIRREGTEILRVGDDALVSVPARRSHHHVKQSMVLWMVTYDKNGAIAPWAGWEETTQKHAFLSGIEKTVARVRQDIPNQLLCFYLGFGLRGKGVKTEKAIAGGLQSLPRGHIHNVAPLDMTTGYDRVLDGSHPRDGDLAGYFLNGAGEASIAYFKQALRDFGTQFTFAQPIGMSRKEILPRTMYAFRSLEEILDKWDKLKKRVADSWLSHLDQVYQEGPAVPYLPHIRQVQRQLTESSLAVIFPSDDNRRTGNTTNTDPIWGVPFPVTGGPTLLTIGGVVFDHGAQ